MQTRRTLRGGARSHISRGTTVRGPYVAENAVPALYAWDPLAVRFVNSGGVPKWLSRGRSRINLDQHTTNVPTAAIGRPGWTFDETADSGNGDRLIGPTSAESGSMTSLTCCWWTVRAGTNVAGDAFQDVIGNANVAGTKGWVVLANDSTNDLSLFRYSGALGALADFSAVSVVGTVFHFCLTYDQSNTSLYIDGVFSSSVAHAGAIDTASLAIALGYGAEAARGFNGSNYTADIDDRVWTSTEIRQHYETTRKYIGV